MEVLHEKCIAPAGLRGGTLALGNFDGVHLGHQTVIMAAHDHASVHGGPTLVATFAPHPSLYFSPHTPPFALTTLDQKLKLFATLGVDAAVVIPFDADLARLEPEDFVDLWLVERLGVRHVVMGFDSTFGRARSGNMDTLTRLGPTRGFTAERIAPVQGSGGVISSTRIRQAVQDGDMALAARLLTRPFTIAGQVVHGDKRGRTIGFPTANVELGGYIRPRYGVYAVRVRLPDGQLLPGAANIGIRPMFTPPVELLEVCVFDWSGDLYGKVIEVELIAFLRPELVFDGLEALRENIQNDIVKAREILG